MKKQLLVSVFLAVIMSAGSLVQAQIPTQKIRGSVIDKDSRAPLIGASVSIPGSESDLGSITDMDGNFEITGVPVGRVQLECTYIGYSTYLSDPFILNAARVHEMQIQLIESVIAADEVVVTAKKFGNEPLNELSILSARSFSVEETQRYAASANDPGRMVMGFPGVQPSRDSRSDIIIRGNSGIGMLWRLEGIDIPNPNHFARRGNSGGGITIFSVSMLANSDFSTAAFPAEYGNATSGVFDIKFRKGNATERQHSFRAGLLGLDYSTEGPFNKERGSSYLLNYRYSTLGILNKMGLHLVGPRVDNTFQDLSFNLSFPSRDKKRYLNVWGMGGLSRERENAIDGVENWKSYSDYFTRDFNSNMGALGVSWLIPAGYEAFLKTNLAIMGQDILFQNDTLDADLRETLVNDERYKENRLVLSSTWNKKFGPKLSLKTGLILTGIQYDMYWQSLGAPVYIDVDGYSLIQQTFAQLRYRPLESLTINAGLHATKFEEAEAIEPRIGIKYQINESNSIMAAWGMHSKVLPLGNYFYELDDKVIDKYLLKSNHTVLGYEWLPGSDWKIRLELYYQSLYDVPVSSVPGSSWSILNTIDGFAREILITEGSGQNTGIDLTLEKSFNKGIFFLISASVFDSKYTDASGRTFPTVFDSGFSATGMGGKEWNLKNGNQLSLSLRAIYNGGQRLTPILESAPTNRYAPEPVLDDSRAFSEQVQAYFRTDLRFSFRKNNAKTAWWIALDIQNVTNRRNIDALNRVYDPDLNTWIYREQSGLTPIISFQYDF